ncbi:PREDICTED: protein FAM179A-like [Priapulus caudatus]|uniref:Protein FAM179A-like n=1 Tax=Priapulus caudatus TaxID=37621 RepID=A0ABM1E5E9_PRICU|nr:PREDICTED: protein FAM179A-like [Priapulus caudatus]
MASKNKEIVSTSVEVLDLMMSYLDYAVLLPQFANQAQFGNMKGKPDIVRRLSVVSVELWPHKQSQVVRHTLPVLWSLLEEASVSGNAELRSAAQELAVQMYSVMGQPLVEQADIKHKSLLMKMLR